MGKSFIKQAEKTLKPSIQLKQHQQEGVDRLIRNGGSLIFSHPTGSGKTLTGIAGFDALKKRNMAQKALVVVPASLRENFAENGLQKFTNYDYTVYGTKAEHGKAKVSDINTIHNPPTFGIVSYDLFRKNPEKYIKNHHADTVIFDELHRSKNDYSLTYDQLKASRNLYKNFIGLTGSVISNSPSDVVPLIDVMSNGQHRLGSKTAFNNRFISENKQGRYINNITAVKSLIGPYIHHIDGLDNDNKAPIKEFNRIEIPMSTYQTDLYRYVYDNLDPITRLKLKAKVGKISKAETLAVFNKLMLARQVSNSVGAVDKNLSLEDSALQTPKIQKVVSDIKEHIATTPDAQIVVYSEFIGHGIDVVAKALDIEGIKYAKFVGAGNGVSKQTRVQSIEDFNAGKVKVLLLSSAGGEGLNLPNTTMFLTLDGHYNPEKIDQAEARGIRMGGQLHRDPKDRKVIVNRYLSTVPTRKTEVAYNMLKTLSPQTYLERLERGEKLWKNPFESIKSTDLWIDEMATNKKKLNSILFNKTANLSPGFFTQKHLMNAYQSEFGPTLAQGNYTDKMIDPVNEGKYITELRNFYNTAKKTKSSTMDSKDMYKKIPSTKLNKPLSRKEAFAQLLKLHTVGNAVTAGVVAFPILQELVINKVNTGKYKFNPKFLNTALPLLSAMTLYGSIKRDWDSSKHPITDVSKSLAATRSKFKDYQLLSLLRGESIKQVKTKEHFI